VEQPAARSDGVGDDVPTAMFQARVANFRLATSARDFLRLLTSSGDLAQSVGQMAKQHVGVTPLVALDQLLNTPDRHELCSAGLRSATCV
jgi:hypothetical protein